MTRRSLQLTVACLLVAGSALAAPKNKSSKAAFDRGVAAYTKGDYAGASAALEKSFNLEADPETLFAWAQTERKLEHCDKAIELYTNLLAMNLPAENKQVINVQIGECKDILAAQKPVTSDVASPPPDEPPPVTAEGRAWWKDPVGGTLVGAGVVGLGVGVVFLVQASSADGDKAAAATYPEYEALDARAESRGRLGMIGMTLGGALVAGGIVWYATHGEHEREPAVSGWLAPTGGGLAVGGHF